MGRLGIRFERPEKKPSASRGHRLEAGGRENARRSGRVQRVLQASLAEARKPPVAHLPMDQPCSRRFGGRRGRSSRSFGVCLLGSLCRSPTAEFRLRLCELGFLGQATDTSRSGFAGDLG